MTRMNITCIILGVIYSIVKFDHSDPFFSAILYISIGVIFILLLMYLISILQFANENFKVQNPFSILLGLGIISLLSELFFPRQTGDLTMGISIINVVLVVYVLIATFKIKSPILAHPFKILGFVWSISTLTKLSLLFSKTTFLTRDQLVLCADLINVTPLLAIYYVIRQTEHILNKTVVTNTETTNLL